MAGRKNGLGRGLDALFPEKTAASKEPVRKTVTKAERTEKKVSRSVKAKEENHDAEEKKTAMMVKISSVEPNVNHTLFAYMKRTERTAVSLSGITRLPVI